MAALDRPSSWTARSADRAVLRQPAQSRWGRRHPFIVRVVGLVALKLGRTLWNPPHWSHAALFYYLIGTSIVIRTFISFYEVPSSALAAEFSSNYDERSELLSYRYFFGWVGGLPQLSSRAFFLFTFWTRRYARSASFNFVASCPLRHGGFAVMFVARS